MLYSVGNDYLVERCLEILRPIVAPSRSCVMNLLGGFNNRDARVAMAQCQQACAAIGDGIRVRADDLNGMGCSTRAARFGP